MFEIIKGLPIPEKKSSLKDWKRASKYPFGEMEIGDCIKFKAEGFKDPNFKKVYGSAMSYARRVKKGFRFVFAQIEPGVFGCWKVETNKSIGEESPTPNVKLRKRADTTGITKQMLISALENQGSMVGASNVLGISTRTFSRLKQKFDLITN